MRNDNFLNFFLQSIKELKPILQISLLDINLKYRRTILGNIWTILTYFITISIISIVWSVVFKTSIAEYFPRIFIGFTTFYLILSLTAQSSEILYRNYSGIILSLGVGLHNVILRHLIFIVLEYIQLIPFYLIIILIAGIKFSLSTLLFIPGLLLVIANGYWMIFIFSLMCARFRDLGLFVSAVLSAFILLTPILWKKEMLGKYEMLVYLNPITSMIEAIRDPLLGYPINPIIYVLLLVYLFLGFLASSILYKYKKNLFNFWI